MWLMLLLLVTTIRSHPLGITEISQLVYGQDNVDDDVGAGGGSGNPLFAEYNVSL